MSDPMQEAVQQPQGEISLPIEWYIPDGMVPRYATNFTIQATEHEFVMSFFDAPPPLIIGDSDEVQRQLAALHAVRATCVAQVVIARGRMAGFVGMIAQLAQGLQADQSDQEEVVS